MPPHPYLGLSTAWFIHFIDSVLSTLIPIYWNKLETGNKITSNNAIFGAQARARIESTIASCFRGIKETAKGTCFNANNGLEGHRTGVDVALSQSKKTVPKTNQIEG